ncbi:MAG: ATP-binding protein, partial [Scytonema sp. CRU_2_7]|nr:ATP-binding protein [Scytonema sp. CRU_2_7]
MISPDAVTGIFPPQTATMLSNLVYEFAANPVPKLLVCLSSYVELPVELIPLIPVLINPLPSTLDVKTFVRDSSNSQFATNNSDTQQFEILVRTCLGLPMGELEMLFSRLSV